MRSPMRSWKKQPDNIIISPWEMQPRGKCDRFREGVRVPSRSTFFVNKHMKCIFQAIEDSATMQYLKYY